MPASAPPPYTRPPRHDTNRTGTFAVLVVLVLIVLLAILFLVFTDSGGGGGSDEETVAVPSVINKPVADAQAELRAAGFEPEVQEVDNDNFPPGTVFAQDPVGGAKVERGTTVRIQVSRGNTMVRVDGVIGSHIDEAENRLLSRGFQVVRQPDATSTRPEGEVVRQEPEAGALLAIGQTVTLYFSSPEEKDIPDLKGQDPVTAAADLTRLGFLVQRQDESSDTIEEGKVTRTDPAAGSRLKVGQQITLFVSSGLPENTVPTVTGLTTDAAVKVIQEAGFVAQAQPQPASGPDVGRVLSQNPPANTQARKGSTVVLVYGAPQATPTTATPTTAPTTTTNGGG